MMACDTNSSDPLTFQWYKDDVLLPWYGKKNVLQDVEVSSIGKYHCIAASEFQVKHSNDVMFMVTVSCCSLLC